MANHVYFNLQVEGLNEEQWESLFKSEEVERPHWDETQPPIKLKQLIDIHEQPFMSNIPREYDEDGWIKDSYNWYCNNCGAKWVDIEEWEHPMLTGYSAWSSPQEMAINLLEYASNKFKTELSAKMTCEDEFRNFIGIDEFETYQYEDEYSVSHDEHYVDGNDLNNLVEERFDCNVSDEDFEWGEVYKDTDVVPQEWLDDLVYNFFETGELNGTV